VDLMQYFNSVHLVFESSSWNITGPLTSLTTHAFLPAEWIIRYEARLEIELINT